MVLQRTGGKAVKWRKPHKPARWVREEQRPADDPLGVGGLTLSRGTLRVQVPSSTCRPTHPTARD